jgi:dephospho-CoA kinase
LNIKLVIGVVGMPGSGKGVLGDVARELGFSVVIMGDTVREEVAKRELEPTPENVGRIMLQIRREKGPAIVAERCITRIKSAESQGIVVEGIRSLAEVEVFRREFPKFKLLSIHSSPETRFQRIFNRRRSDDPSNWQVFTDRDLRELKVGIGSAAAMADYVILNEGSLRQFKMRVKRLLKASLSG